MAEAFHWVVIGFLATAVLLFYFIPAERTRLRSTVILFVIALCGLFG